MKLGQFGIARTEKETALILQKRPKSNSPIMVLINFYGISMMGNTKFSVWLFDEC